MVYRGKPSKSCGECRLRRTRCDLLKPSCTQCIRKGRTCSGYRDLGTLMFRDCTKSFTKNNPPKIPNAVPNPEQVVEITSPTSSNPGSPAWSDQFDNSFMFDLQYASIEEEVATCFFFKNHASGDPFCSRWTFQYLINIYHGGTVSTPLADAVVAIGMAGLAHCYNDPSLMVSAKMKYSSALSSISTLLRDSISAREDQSLIAVILLGVYESNTCSDAESMEALHKHVSGAETLLQLRGKQQIETALGRDLFAQTRAQIIARCWQTNTAVPDYITEWSEAAQQYEKAEEVAATKLSQISSRLCNLRMISAQIGDSSSPYEFQNSGDVIASAMEIDIQLAEWAATCPSSYRYQTEMSKIRSKDSLYSHNYDVYGNISIANTWNEYRVIRILVNELLLQHSRPIIIQQDLSVDSPEMGNQGSFFDDLIRDSASMAVQLASNICRSVPFYLGFSSTDSSQAMSRKQHPKSITGNFLMWPLYVAARTESGSEMREWAIKGLRMIGEDMGIMQAVVVADCIANNEECLF